MTDGATIHGTTCGKYVVEIAKSKRGATRFTCRSLSEAYDVLRSRRIRTATFTQTVAYDEMVGLPGSGGPSVMPVTVPPR